MPIRDALIEALRAAFPDRAFKSGAVGEPVAVFAAAHPSVGDASLFDDGDEIMVAIGEITHRHFDADDDVPAHDRMRIVVTQAVEFLADMFADRVVVWRHPLHRGFGGSVGPCDEMEFSMMSKDAETFRWSGPTPNPHRASE